MNRSTSPASLPLAILVAATLCLAGGPRPALAQAAAPSTAEAGDLMVAGVNIDANGRSPFTMYVKGGQMRMDQGDRTMLLRSAGDRPGILFLDHDAKRGTFLPAATVSEGESAVSAETVSYEPDVEPLPGLEELSPIPETVTIVRGGEREVVPIAPTSIGFRFEGDATLPGMDQASIPPDMKDMIRVVMRSDTRAAVDPSLPGTEPLRAFYRAMAHLETADAPPQLVSMTGGLIAITNQIAQAGFPVWNGNRTRVQVEVDGPMAGMMEGALNRMPGVGSTLSVSVVEVISTDPVDPDLFYGGAMPPGYDIDVVEGG